MTSSEISVRGRIPIDVRLRSERLLLRPYCREDLDVEATWPDFEEPIYQHYNPPRDELHSRDRRWLLGLRLFDLKLGIMDGQDLVGYVGLYESDYDQGLSWMGIQFAANRRSKGYCKETLKLLCSAFFTEWKMQVMKLEVAAFNLPGIRCYETVGWVVSKQFWHSHAYQRHLDFENDIRLQPVAHHFRRNGEAVEVDYFEMELNKARFLSLAS